MGVTMKQAKTVLGYGAAGLTLVAMAIVPFVLMPVFTRAVAATGVRVSPVFGGGKPVATISKGTYSITVHQPVRSPAPLSRVEPYVQLTWAPASALPPRVADVLDIDGDGQPDLQVRFGMTGDKKASLLVDVEALNTKVRSLRQVSRESFSALIAHVGDAIVVRVPLHP